MGDRPVLHHLYLDIRSHTTLLWLGLRPHRSTLAGGWRRAVDDGLLFRCAVDSWEGGSRLFDHCSLGVILLSSCWHRPSHPAWKGTFEGTRDHLRFAVFYGRAARAFYWPHHDRVYPRFLQYPGNVYHPHCFITHWSFTVQAVAGQSSTPEINAGHTCQPRTGGAGIYYCAGVCGGHAILGAGKHG